MIYYLRYAEDQSLKMTAEEFLSFLSDHVAGNEMFEAYMSGDQREMLSQIGNYAEVVGMFAGNDPMTPKQMAEMPCESGMLQKHIRKAIPLASSIAIPNGK